MPDYYSFLDAAEIILAEAGQPMTASAITSEALRRRLILTSGKTPVETMTARLYEDVQRNPATRFMRVAELGKARARRGSVQWTLQTRR